MVAGDIVHHREVQVPVLGLDDVIVGHFVRRAPFARGYRSDALLLGIVPIDVEIGEAALLALSR
jgi:hypothetical protein